jgi:hypothetical protein
MVGEALRDWLDRNVTKVAGPSSLDYERRFRVSERLFSMGTSRFPNHDHEHAMWKQDRYILVQEKCAHLGFAWVQIESAEGG